MTDAPSLHVLDASAVLALLHREAGWRKVARIVDRSAISTVNWSEVAQKSLQHGRDVPWIESALVALGLSIAPFTAEDALEAARMWKKTRSRGLSLGDRACLALAFRLAVPAVTTDRAWSRLRLPGVRILRAR